MHKDRPAVRSSSREYSAPEDQAAEHLHFIRQMMERSGSFTAVPGWGMVAMGVSAIPAGVIAGLQSTSSAWLAVWLIEAVVAIGIGAVALIHKARRADVALRSGPGRKYMLSLLPPIVAGALISVALLQSGQHDLLPGLWMLLYGAGTMTGGAFSIRVVPLMGLVFMGLGIPALFVPFAWSHVLMVVGFGGLHILFGLIIARNHGG